MELERLYGYGIGIVAGLVTIGAIGYPALRGWIVLLLVLVWAARRTSQRPANEQGEHDADVTHA